MTPPASPPPRSLARRLARALLFWGLLPLCLLFLAAAGSLFLLCNYKPDIVAARVQQLLNDSTGLPWRIRGHIMPSFRSGFGIAASDVRILAATVDQRFYANAARPLVQAKALRLYLDPASLWEFSPRFSLIELDEPTVNLVYDTQGRPLWMPLDEPEQPPDEAFTVKEGSGITLKSVADAVCSPQHVIVQPVLIRNGTFASYTSAGELFLSFTGVNGRFNPGDDGDNNLRLSASFDLPDADLVVHFAIAARVGCDDIPATGTLSGEVTMTPPGSRGITASLVTGFTWESNGKDILMPDFRLLAEGDSLSANLVMDMAKAECTGKVNLHGVSLPRWFEWGRVLPPGLQLALHKLTGSFDLVLNGQKAEAQNLEGIAGPLEIKGYVGAPDFNTPTVVVHAQLQGTPDLDQIFPFLGVAGRHIPEPEAPIFGHPPLAPYPQDPPAPYDPGPSSVGYDINILASRAQVHGVTGGPLTVRVFPLMVGKVEKTRVSIVAEGLMKGRAEGYLDIDREQILMHYDAQDMELALLPENELTSAKVSGRVTGGCDISMPMGTEGGILDDWPIRINAAIKGLKVDGSFRGDAWHIGSSTASVKGTGSIHAVLKEGVRLEGRWDVAAQNVASSWHRKGGDNLSGVFDGGLFWPPIKGGSQVLLGADPKLEEKRGVERVAGKLTLQGSLTSPLGSMLIAIGGKLDTNFEWLVYGERLSLANAEFDGMGSAVEGQMKLDFSDRETVLQSEAVFKLNPRELLRSWKISTPKGIRAPRLITGRSEINMDGGELHLKKIKVEADGAPISGEISREPNPAAPPGDPGRWTVRLTAEHLDLENIFPPDTPAQGQAQQPQPGAQSPAKAWDLSFTKGLFLDAQVYLNKARKGKLSFDQSRLAATVQRDRFSFEWNTNKFYGGTSTLILQGTIVPESSQVTVRKGLSQMKGVSLGPLLYDATGDRSYAGTADLSLDISGVLNGYADFPGKLSGSWSMSITDGLYPGFLTSEDSTLRNTFSLASASGPLDRGVLRSKNFKLTGTMVDMHGEGWFDLNSKNMDIELSVTFAKVPTVPVRFYGNAAKPQMKVRGVDMVVETMQNAGSTAFGLIRGVFELPARAVQGIGSLFGKQDTKGKGQKQNKPRQQHPQTMPLTPPAQHKGQTGKK